MLPRTPQAARPRVSFLNRLRVVLVLLSINWGANPIPKHLEEWLDQNDPDGKLRKRFGFIRKIENEPDSPTRFWIYAMLGSIALILAIVTAQLLRLHLR